MITIFDIITSNHIADIIITCNYFRFNTYLVNLESSNKHKQDLIFKKNLFVVVKNLKINLTSGDFRFQNIIINFQTK